jgi:hypothetical protein
MGPVDERPQECQLGLLGAACLVPGQEGPLDAEDLLVAGAADQAGERDAELVDAVVAET